MRKMSANRATGKKNRPKTKLGIPDLEYSKAAALRSLGSPDSSRGYQHAIDEFVAWYGGRAMEERAPTTMTWELGEHASVTLFARFLGWSTRNPI